MKFNLHKAMFYNQLMKLGMINFKSPSVCKPVYTTTIYLGKGGVFSTIVLYKCHSCLCNLPSPRRHCMAF